MQTYWITPVCRAKAATMKSFKRFSLSQHSFMIFLLQFLNVQVLLLTVYTELSCADIFTLQGDPLTALRVSRFQICGGGLR